MLFAGLRSNGLFLLVVDVFHRGVYKFQFNYQIIRQYGKGIDYSFDYIQISMGNSKSLYSKQELLYFYIEKNDIVSINQLIEANPTLINEPINKDTKQTALMRATYNGNTQLVQLLLSLRVDVNAATPKGQTALSIAVKRNHQTIAQLLVDCGANVGFVSKIGLRVIQYGILAGFYEVSQLVYKKLTRQQKQAIQDPKTYAQLGKKYAYRYVNYERFLQGLFQNKDVSEVDEFLRKEKKKLADPVADPRETWKQWVKRQLEWKDAPLVERSELPQHLQPQNRVLGTLHHYTNNFVSTHLSQKTSLKPKQKSQTASQLRDLAKGGKGQTQQKMNYEVHSQV